MHLCVNSHLSETCILIHESSECIRVLSFAFLYGSQIVGDVDNDVAKFGTSVILLEILFVRTPLAARFPGFDWLAFCRIHMKNYCLNW